jgi:transcription antitermination factor NusG
LKRFVEAGMGWCVAQTEAGRAPTALRGLEGLARDAIISEVFNPSVDGKPLLAGYIFVNMDAQDGGIVHRVRHLKGIASLLPVGHEYPIELRPGVIDQLRIDLDAGDYSDASVLPAHRFKKGEMMRIVSGPYSVFSLARFCQVDHGMVIGEITLLGRTAKVRLKGHQVEPL